MKIKPLAQVHLHFLLLLLSLLACSCQPQNSADLQKVRRELESAKLENESLRAEIELLTTQRDNALSEAKRLNEQRAQQQSSLNVETLSETVQRLFAENQQLKSVVQSQRDTLARFQNGSATVQPQYPSPDYVSPQTASPVAENGSYNGEPNQYGVPKTVHVEGYYRKDGTYVRGHYRSAPRR